MENEAIAIVKVDEFHEPYDSRFSQNGGSYYQPFYWIAFSDGTQATLSDTSCGDFGSRYSLSVYRNDHDETSWAVWGSMLRRGEEFASIEEKDIPYLDLLTERFDCFAEFPEEDEEEA